MPQDPESSKLTTRPPLAAITGAMVQPPSRVYIGVDDRLYIRSRNSLGAVTLQIAGRLLTAEGVIVPFNFEHVPLSTRAASLESFRLAEGYLLSVIVFPSVGAPRRGQTFVELGLLRGRAVAASVVDVLARDYVVVDTPLAFPGTPIRSSIEGQGLTLSLGAADPAAGAEIAGGVPSNARWLLKAMRFTLVTDANPATRVVHLILDDGTTTLLNLPATGTQDASLTRNYNVHELGGLIVPTGSEIDIGLPSNVILPAGFRIATETTLIEAGDNYGAPQLWVEEWIQD